VHLFRHARDDGGGGAPLDAQDDQFADDVARDGGTAALYLGRLDGLAGLAARHVPDALRLVRELPALKVLALEPAARVGPRLVAQLDLEALILRAVDGQVVADFKVVLGAEVNEDHLVAREHFARVAGEDDAAGLFARRLGEAVEHHFGAQGRDYALRHGAQQVSEQDVVAGPDDLGHRYGVAHTDDADAPDLLRVDAERAALARQLRAELPARPHHLKLLPRLNALPGTGADEQHVALGEVVSLALVLRADDLVGTGRKALLDGAAALRLTRAPGGGRRPLGREQNCRALLPRRPCTRLSTCRKLAEGAKYEHRRKHAEAPESLTETHG
jgi:hypothetical protein